MTDFVSIIIPYYKKKKFFKSTIKSILNQSFKSYEVILIYDDKDKRELSYVKKILHTVKNKKIIVNNKNYGAAISRNIGIKCSKGNFISFLDADDTWHKNKLKTQIYFMKKKKIKFSFTNYSIVNTNDLVVKKVKSPRKIEFHKLLYSCDIALSSVVVKYDVLQDNKFYPIKTKEDYLLWLNLSFKNLEMLRVNQYFTYWRKTKKSLSSSVFQKLKDAYFIYNKSLKFNMFKSLIFIFFLSFNSIVKRYL